MSGAVEAADFLLIAEPAEAKPVCVLVGEEWFLKAQALAKLRQAVLGAEGDEFALSRFDGECVTFADVAGELSTVGMFGGGRRVVVVEAADKFVTAFRPQLERYVSQPSPTGVLVLDVRSFPTTSRLYKMVAESGLVVQCSGLAGGRLKKWLRSWAKQAHGLHLDAASADLLVEMVGTELGLLDQELRKLALYAGQAGRVTEGQIRHAVGSWRAKTAWVVLDAALAGDVRKAMTELDRLLLAGEQPLGVLGQISASLRRLAATVRIVDTAGRQGRRTSLAAALAQAGVPRPFLRKTEAQLRRLGRERAERLYGWLLEADLDMKGASMLPPRLILERLILRLAAPPGAPG